MHRIIISILVVLALACAADTGSCANPQAITFSYPLAARAKLNITPATINFPDADPTLFPSVSAAENPIQAAVRIRKDPSAALTATLVCQMTTPLTSGADTIPASAISWTATGSGFNGGTMNSATPQLVGVWTTSGAYLGNLTFRMNNLWTYATGSYSGTILFTLTAP